MKQYTVFFNMVPSVGLDSSHDGFSITIDPGKTKITINKIEKEASIRYQIGLRFKNEIFAETIDEAILKSQRYDELFSELLSFIGGVGLPTPELWIAYESTEGIEEREFVQLIHNPFNPNISRSTFRIPYFTTFMSGFQQYGEEEKDRVIRSLHWFRMGILEQDKFDSYICQWTSLETLEPVFLKKMGITGNERKCPECRATLPGPPKVTGIPNFFDTVEGAGSDLYWSLSRLRNDIVHGNDPFQELQKRLDELQPKLTRMLIASLHYLTGIPVPAKDRPIIRGVGTKLHISTTLIGFDPHGAHKNLLTPHVKIKNLSYEPYRSEKGIGFNIYWDYHVLLPDGVAATEISARAIGHDPDMEIMDMTIKKKD